MLNLANSFRLRNKVKEKISKLQQLVADAEFTKDKGTPEDVLKTDGANMMNVIMAIDNLMKELTKLNQAIAEANVVNSANLIELESAKAFIAYYEKLANRSRNLKTYRMEMNATAGYEKIELEPIVNQNEFLSKLDCWKKTKDSLEEQLAESNFKTAVHFNEEELKKLL